MEQTILHWINQTATAPWLDQGMAIASSWDLWWPILLVALPLLLWRGGFRGRAMLVCAGVCIFFVDAVTVNGLKKLVGRPRPSAVLDGVRVVDLVKTNPRLLALGQPAEVHLSQARIAPQRGGSFPSGHAANNFCVATVVFVFYRRWGWLMFFPAGLVAYSRIYVGSHWPTDVVVSIFLAVGVTLLVLAVLDKLWERWLAPRWPRLGAAHPRLWGARSTA